LFSPKKKGAQEQEGIIKKKMDAGDLKRESCSTCKKARKPKFMILSGQGSQRKKKVRREDERGDVFRTRRGRL